MSAGLQGAIEVILHTVDRLHFLFGRPGCLSIPCDLGGEGSVIDGLQCAVHLSAQHKAILEALQILMFVVRYLIEVVSRGCVYVTSVYVLPFSHRPVDHCVRRSPDFDVFGRCETAAMVDLEGDVASSRVQVDEQHGTHIRGGHRVELTV